MKSYFKPFLVNVESLRVGTKVRCISGNNLTATLYVVKLVDVKNEVVFLEPVVPYLENGNHFFTLEIIFGTRVFNEDEFIFSQVEL